MSREAEMALRMATDATLMAILTGEVWTPSGYILSPAIVVGHKAGLDGITREETAAAFDTDGYLKPTALVKQRANVPDGNVKDYGAQVTSTTQIVEIWLYQDRGYDQLDLAAARLYVLFYGKLLAGSFELDLVNVIDRQYDRGALKGASMIRQDWAVYSV